jgi:hypothetical protein
MICGFCEGSRLGGCVPNIIFKKLRLNPSQLHAVAELRFEDAECLRRSGTAKRANGVFYLGGSVIECLLKARLIQEYPELRSPPEDRSNWDKQNQELFNLCYRWHDLSALLDHLPIVREELQRIDPSGQLLRSLIKVCKEWTVYARYSPHTARMSEAEQFLAQIREVKPWLRRSR